MLRMIIPLVVIFLLYLLVQTFMMRSGEKPIDVDPIDPDTTRSEDDVIDVEAVDPEAEAKHE